MAGMEFVQFIIFPGSRNHAVYQFPSHAAPIVAPHGELLFHRTSAMLGVGPFMGRARLGGPAGRCPPDHAASRTG